MDLFTESFLSKYLCGFRKGYSCQYSLLSMLRKWQSSLNDSGIVGAVLMDLSKAFDCLPHDLLIAKLHAYGFCKKTVDLFHSYLSQRRHYTRVGSASSTILEIILGVPQGSVLGPLLFNVFINDLLILCKEDICNFADDNTMFVCRPNLLDVLSRIDREIAFVINWFLNNGMVANPDKFQVIFLGTGNQEIKIKIGSCTIENSSEVKLLGVTIDSKLSFFPHILNICGKATAKIKALTRIRNCLDQTQADSLYFSHIMAPLNYCPLVWMFCSKQAFNLLNRTHHRALKARFNNYSAILEDLLLFSSSPHIHSRNLALLVREVYKTLNFLNPKIMWNTFELKEPNKYELRRGRNLFVPKARSSRAVNSFDFRAAMAWNNLPNDVKNASSLTLFDNLLKTQNIYSKCNNCSN